MVIGLLGILKAGGAYLPLDPEYPRRTAGRHDGGCGLRVVLAQRRCSGVCAGAGRRCRAHLCGSMPTAGIAAQPAPPRRSSLDPGHLAYVIYTSGSTGKPKGAANTHAGLHNRLAWMQDAYGLTLR